MGMYAIDPGEFAICLAASEQSKSLLVMVYPASSSYSQEGLNVLLMACDKQQVECVDVILSVLDKSLSAVFSATSLVQLYI